jgi:hypothetical protein
MARPTTDVVWATTGGTQIEPSAGEKASGHVPGTRPPARKLNWLMGHIAAWIAWLRDDHDRIASYIGGTTGLDEWVYPAGSEPGRVVFVSMDDLRWDTAADGTAPQWSMGRDPSSSAYLLSRSDYGVVVLPLTPYLRRGMVLSEVKIAYKPGAARTGGSRSQAGVWREVPDFSVASNNPVGASIVGAVKSCDTTAGEQFITLATAEIGDPVIARESGSYKLGIYAGSDGGAHVPDKIYGIRLSFIDPGPRNF